MHVVDIHSHFFPADWENLEQKFGTPDWPWMKHLDGAQAVVMKGGKEFRRVSSACWDAQQRLEELDEAGVDRQIICATPVLFAYDRPPAHAAYCAQLFNDAALELCANGRQRLFAMAQVPLQDVDASCREISRAKAAGHVGVQIGNHVGSKDLDDTSLITFLQHCAAEQMPVFVHPWDMLGAPRTANYMLAWTVGMPAETHLSIAAMILGGVFDRLGPDLKICFAHGGGSFAFLLGRLENAWHQHASARGRAEHAPSHYLDRFYVDSAVFDAGSLRLLIDKMGAQRIMFGTDYPFLLGERIMGKLIRGTSGISDKTRQTIFAENADRFFFHSS